MKQNRFFGLLAILAGIIAAMSGVDYSGAIKYAVVFGGICWIIIGIYWMIKG